MSSYEKALAAKALEDRGAPPEAVDDWLDEKRLLVDGTVQQARAACMEAFLPREERTHPLFFVSGGNGTGKTVAAVVGLGEAVAEAFRRQRAGRLDMQRARSHIREQSITPEQVRKVLGMDWETFQANERAQPGVCAAQVRAAYAAEQPWDYELCPLSFAFWDAPERASRQGFGWETERELEHARSCDVLVIDDLGAEYFNEKTPWPAHLTSIINARYSHRLATVVTTNRNLKDFCERYSARVVDRFRQLGVVSEVSGKSRRLPRGAR